MFRPCPYKSFLTSLFPHVKTRGEGYNFWSFDPNAPFNEQPFYRIDTKRIMRPYGEPKWPFFHF